MKALSQYDLQQTLPLSEIQSAPGKWKVLWLKKLTAKGEQGWEKMVHNRPHPPWKRVQGSHRADHRERSKWNIAAVRYYFGSKEELIGAALEYMMSALENASFPFLMIPGFRRQNGWKSASSDTLPSPISTPLSSAPSPAHPALTRGKTYFIYLNLLHDQSWEKVILCHGGHHRIYGPPRSELKCMQIFSRLCEFPIILEKQQ